MKYLFILGRNIELSAAELESFFAKNGWSFEKLGLVGNGLLVESSAKVEKGTIRKLGGAISIGGVLASGHAEEIIEKLEKQGLHNARGNKLNYVIHNFSAEPEPFEEVEEYLKSRFRSEKLKATQKKLTGNIEMQSGGKVGKVTSNLIDEQFFVFSHESKGENYFGKIIESAHYDEIEKRDMNKPVRRNELAISPRLAKILINLSGIREGETLLDPFCGIGVVLEEALLQGIKVVGVDIDKKAIEGAKENLEFFGFDKKDYRLINDDSSKTSSRAIGMVSGIATEPDLGELQKKLPTEAEARKVIAGFEKLMAYTLKNLGKNSAGRIAFTAPLILAGNGKKRVSCDFEKIAKSARREILQNIDEFREKQIVGRSIVVLG